MRNFWKRTNRGLILAGVLIAGTACYVGFDYLRFTNGKKDMEKLLEDYCKELSASVVLPKDKADYSYTLSDEEKKAYSTLIQDTVRKYWSEPKDINTDDYFVKSDILTFCADAAAGNSVGKIYEYNINASNLKFKKNGSGAALFSMNVSYKVMSTGSCFIPTLSNSYYVTVQSSQSAIDFPYDSDEIMTKDTDAVDDKENNSDEYKGDLSSTATIPVDGELIYVDGAWKINYINYSYLGDDFNTVPVKGGN